MVEPRAEVVEMESRSEGIAARGADKRKFKHRKLLIGSLIVLAVPPAVVKAAAWRLRRRPDPEAGEVLSEPLGEESRCIESFDTAGIFVEELGSGPTLVLVHGFFCNTDMWHYQKKGLADRYHVICYDQRGHRRSETTDGVPIDLETMARDLKVVLDELAPGEPVVLAGHSMGGMAIMKFAHMFPGELGSRVKGVALVDTAHVPLTSCILGGGAVRPIKGPLIVPLFKWVTEHPRFSDRAKDMVINSSAFLVATRYLGYGSRASLTQMEYISEMAGKTSIAGACLAGLGILANEEVIPLEALERSGIPVLIWVGEKDRLTRAEASRLMKQELPRAELRVIPDTGHPSYMEEYREFNRTLDELAARAFGHSDVGA